jgi:hypothetical protein
LSVKEATAAISHRHDEGRLAAAGRNDAAKSASGAKSNERRTFIRRAPGTYSGESIKRRALMLGNLVIERRALNLENLVVLRARALR